LNVKDVSIAGIQKLLIAFRSGVHIAIRNIGKMKDWKEEGGNKDGKIY